MYALPRPAGRERKRHGASGMGDPIPGSSLPKVNHEGGLPPWKRRNFMKKRILSIVCALALCIGLLPATALAAGNWTYYPKSDAEDRLYGYIEQNGLRVA